MLVIEPLAIAIRSNLNIIGIKKNETDNKIGLFTDDIVILLSHLEQSLHHMCNVISSFSKLSNYKIND